MKLNSQIKIKCPFTGDALEIDNNGLINSKGELLYPKINGAFRIVSDNNYSQNFGFQWNKFQKTQIDREVSNSKQSTERLLTTTSWDKENLQGKSILEVGCGAGRFTRVVLEHTNAQIHSVDYSNAVEACYVNNKDFENRLFIYQASVYELPFEKNQFDKVFCFGVLQHTPDVDKSIECLIEMVKQGGELAVDFYPINGWHTKIHAKYIFRPITKKMNHAKLLNLIEKNIGWMIAATNFFNALGIGKLLNRFIPICDIKNTFPTNLTKEEIKEWAILDTFDMFSPEYDSPQKITHVANLFRKNNMYVSFSGYIKYGDNGKVAIVKGIKK